MVLRGSPDRVNFFDLGVVRRKDKETEVEERVTDWKIESRIVTQLFSFLSRTSQRLLIYYVFHKGKLKSHVSLCIQFNIYMCVYTYISCT